MKRRKILSLFCTVLTLLTSIPFFSSCNSSTGANGTPVNDQAIVTCEVGYLTPSEYASGNYSQMTESPSFESEDISYMVIDLIITASKNNEGDEKLNLYTHISGNTIIEPSLEEANTSVFEEAGSGDVSKILTTFIIPKNENEQKSTKTVIKLSKAKNGVAVVKISLDSYCINDILYNDLVGYCELTYEYATYEHLSYKVTGIADESSSMVIIPETYNDLPITEIAENAFNGNTNICEIKIPDTVTTIGYAAFSGCSSLESMTIPFVGNFATATIVNDSTLFGYIFGVDSYDGGMQITQYRSIKTSSFSSGKFSDESVYCVPQSLKSVTVTGGRILSGAFIGCINLTSITIGDDVTSIGDYAFYYCSNLTQINYKGTKKQWKKIDKAIYWDETSVDYTLTYNYR